MRFLRVQSKAIAPIEHIDSTSKATIAPAQPSATQTEFEKDFSKLFGARTATQETNEEEVFATLVFHGLKSKVSEEVADRFKTVFKVQQKILGATHRYASPEEAARSALQYLSQSGDLDSKTRRAISRECFANAQLDNNTKALYDGIGGVNDPTRAVRRFSKVVELMQQKLSTEA